MGVRARNIAKLFEDTRSRTIIIVTAAALLFGLIVGIIVLRRHTRPVDIDVQLSQTPTIQQVPGSFTPSEEYAKLQEQANIERAQQAQKTGQSAIPTIIKAVRPGEGDLIGAEKSPEQPWQAGLSFKELSQISGQVTPKQLALDNIKNRGCTPEAIKEAMKQGASVADLRQAGCTADQLKAAGISESDLLKAGFSACDLMSMGGVDPRAMRAAGYTAGEMKGVGFNACQLKKSGYTADELCHAGFSGEELKGAGYADEEIRRGGCSLAGSIATLAAGAHGISAEALKARGCTPAAVAQAHQQGVPAQEMKHIGCSAAELAAGGYSLAALKAAGFTAGELKAAGYSAADLLKAGFTPAQLKAGGYTAKALMAAGVSEDQLKKAGFSNGELADAGFDISDKAIGDGIAAAGLPQNVSPNELIKQGCDSESLKQAKSQGVSAKALKAKGCTASQLRAAGYNAKDLKDAGFTAGELKAAGFSAKDLKDAGYTAAQLRAAGYSAEDLKKAGFSPRDLKNAGYSAGELLRAGFSPKDLKNAGFTATELKDAGLTPAELKAAGYTAGQLKNAGFDANELKAAGFSANQLKNAGFNNDQLKTAGFSDAELGTTAATPPPTETTVTTAVPSVQTGSAVAPGDTAQDIIQRQQQQIAAQQLQAQIQQMQGNMQGQVTQLFAAWKSPIQSYVEGTPPKEGEAGAAGNGGVGSAQQLAPAMIKAGTIYYGVIETSINSDEPGPVLAKIFTGRFKGATLIGQISTFPPYGQKVMLRFTRMTLPNFPNSFPIDAYAVDPDTARVALSSYTNNHYLMRYGGLFASAFLEGYGQAFLQSGQTINSNGLTTQAITPALNPTGKLLVALGNVGNAFGSAFQELFNRQPTVHVYSGLGIGVLFVNDVANPALAKS